MNLSLFPLFRSLSIWVLITLFFAGCAIAQVSMANATGTVEDSTGARIPDASVRLINVLTGAESDSTTNQYGIFILPGVLPGNYLLQIERDGFATAQFTGITLNIGDTKSFLIRMKLGSIDQMVTVDAEGMVVNTADASVGAVVDRKFVRNIPLNGRSFQDLISMTPGIVTQSPQTVGLGDFSVNGQQTDTNSFIVDGVSGNIGLAGLAGSRKLPSAGRCAGTTALGTTQSLVSVDALQEFRVLGSTYSAEYGDVPGGQFLLLTRSGTSIFHGSAYSYIRNNIFDAQDWFTRFNFSPIGVSFHQQDFGGTLGGPLSLPKLNRKGGKTFFFSSFEGLNVDQPTAPLVQYVPDMPLRQEVPDALKPIINAFPAPGGPPADPKGLGLAPFVSGAFSLPSHIRSTGIRMDHIFSPRLSSFVRYSDTPSDSQSRILSSLSTAHLHTQTFTFGATAQLSTSWSNDVGVGYAKSTSVLDTRLENYLLGQSSDLASDFGVPSSSTSTRTDVYIRIPAIGESEINTDHAASFLHQWDLRDSFTVQAAHHLMRFGFDQRRIVSAVRPPALSIEADFYNRASMLNNAASSIFITKTEPATPVFNEFAAYIQDEWRVSQSISLSLGLRWEVDPPPGELEGKNAYTLLGDIRSPASFTLAPRGTPLWHTSWHNFAPRIGVAWGLNNAPGKDTVLRAGTGIYFDTANQAAVGAFDAVGFSATVHPDISSLPLNSSEFNFSATPKAPYVDSTAFAFPSHLQQPYNLQWNVALDRALGKKQTATLSYVGAAGRRLLQVQSRDIHTLNPNFSEVYFFPNGLTSNYQSLQMRFQRSISPGLQVLASYAWSHALDYGSTAPAFPQVRGNSTFDVRQNFQAAISWDGPKLSGSWSRRNLLTGWGADGRLLARTAFPITMLGNLVSDPVTGDRYYSGVDLVPNRPLYLYGSQYPGGRAINGGPKALNPAFQLPDLNGSGNAPRNNLRGFDEQQVNLALRKDLKLYDRFSLQLRAETFNLFNHPDLGYVDPHLTDALSGQSTLMLNQSFGSGGSLYQQGGPRSVQFMLKLQF